MAMQAPGITLENKQKPSDNNSAVKHVGFAGLAALFLAARLPFLFTVPMQNAPDEFAHYWVIKFLQEHWRLPSAAEVLADGPSAVYGSLPQLGYLPHVAVSMLFPAQMLPLAERFGTLAGGMVMLWAGWRIGRLLFANSRLYAAAVPLMIIFHPQLAFAQSYANNDSTSSALASVLLLLAIETLRHGMTLKRSAVIGALVGWLAITKYSGLAVLPAVALAMLGSWWLHGTSLAVAMPSLAVAALLSITLSGWWFVRNAHEFGGDFMGTKTMYKTWATTFHRDLNYYLSPWKIIKDYRWWRMTFYSFWGLFGYMDKYMWKPVYFVYYAPFITAAAAFIWQSVQALKAKRTPDRLTTLTWLTVACVMATNLAAMIWASIYNLGGPQGRYLFTSEISVAALLVGGMSLCGSKFGPKAVTAFLAFNAITCIGSWIYLFTSYGGFRLSPL